MGVSQPKDSHGKSWKATIVVKQQATYLGLYASAKLAALAYDEEARRRGLDERCNFDLDGTPRDRQSRPGRPQAVKQDRVRDREDESVEPESVEHEPFDTEPNRKFAMTASTIATVDVADSLTALSVKKQSQSHRHLPIIVTATQGVTVSLRKEESQ